MADKKNILVFPAGTEIAFEIHQALRYSKFVRLFGATSVPCHAEFVFARCFEGLPFVNEPGLIEALNRIIDENGIDYVYPAHDSALLRLTQEQEKLHAKVVTSDLQTVEICRDKNKTYAFLAGADYLPRSWHTVEEVPAWPVFIKPAVGQGAQGARRIDSRAALEEALADGVDYAICEYLPGEEFTVDCFTDRHGAPRLCSSTTFAAMSTSASFTSSEGWKLRGPTLSHRFAPSASVPKAAVTTIRATASAQNAHATRPAHAPMGTSRWAADPAKAPTSANSAWFRSASGTRPPSAMASVAVTE